MLDHLVVAFLLDVFPTMSLIEYDPLFQILVFSPAFVFLTPFFEIFIFYG